MAGALRFAIATLAGSGSGKVCDEAFSRLTPQAREMLLQRLQHWALERGSLIILFERHQDGGFSEYLAVREDNLVPLPDEVSDSAFMGPAQVGDSSEKFSRFSGLLSPLYRELLEDCEANDCIAHEGYAVCVVGCL